MTVRLFQPMSFGLALHGRRAGVLNLSQPKISPAVQGWANKENTTTFFQSLRLYRRYGVQHH
jgi:hypothetical protein